MSRIEELLRATETNARRLVAPREVERWAAAVHDNLISLDRRWRLATILRDAVARAQVNSEREWLRRTDRLLGRDTGLGHRLGSLRRRARWLCSWTADGPTSLREVAREAAALRNGVLSWVPEVRVHIEELRAWRGESDGRRGRSTG